MTYIESDWKIFRKRVPEWQERYLTIKNQEITKMLSDDRKTPTERFWEAKEQMKKDARILVDCFDGHSRGKMGWYLFLMHLHKVITDEDLVDFSDSLREEVFKSKNAFNR
ncbi:MAG: hypothetical protein H8D23_03415 [Candidatus Brocadiales bacterium]|nr:hypothetical protein [Candidatus Brocadiales bacterium]